MAIKKVDRHALWEDASVDLLLDTTSDSTSGKTLKAFLTNEAGTEYQVGTASGAAAGTNITIALDLATAGITAGKWYTLRVGADLALSNKIGILPNPNTANKIMIYILPMPTDA